MKRYVAIVIVPLISVGLDQASNIYHSCDVRTSVYTEHLDSICENKYIVQMILFLNELKHKIASRVSIILYASPNTITSSRWSASLKSLISRDLVRLLYIDKCHYITSAGRFLRPEFYTNI